MPRSTSLENLIFNSFQDKSEALRRESSTNLPRQLGCVPRLMPQRQHPTLPHTAHRHGTLAKLPTLAAHLPHPIIILTGPETRATNLWASLSALSSHHLIPSKIKANPPPITSKLSPKLLGKKAPALSLPWTLGAPSTWAKPSAMLTNTHPHFLSRNHWRWKPARPATRSYDRHSHRWHRRKSPETP